MILACPAHSRDQYAGKMVWHLPLKPAEQHLPGHSDWSFCSQGTCHQVHTQNSCRGPALNKLFGLLLSDLFPGGLNQTILKWFICSSARGLSPREAKVRSNSVFSGKRRHSTLSLFPPSSSLSSSEWNWNILKCLLIKHYEHSCWDTIVCWVELLFGQLLTEGFNSLIWKIICMYEFLHFKNSKMVSMKLQQIPAFL